MTTIKEIENTDGTWLFLAPVRNLHIGNAVDFEFTVNRVTFINSSRLAKRRRRYGFNTPLSEIKKKYKGILGSFFHEEKTFATLRFAGKGKDVKQRFINQVNDELSIISLSQLGYSKRINNNSPSLSEEKRLGRRSSLMYNLTNDTSYQPNEVVGKKGSLRLDVDWKEFQKEFFFYDLIKIISGKTKVAPKWRIDITNAAILAGQSQSGQDIPQCFLWNMIALETLLTQRDDKYSEKLPERTEAFIGWAKDWKVEDFETKIKDIYLKRCLFVHTGQRDHISVADILFSDDLLLNVLNNIVKHPRIFGSKRKLIEFSEKVRAEHTLGIKTKVRPKTLRLLRPQYTKNDLEEI
ncbi:MAG: HEPN domain-containing protein [Desulfobulbaceae bacterium]|nr:HEPN domain-containing protein [Desulfobulbaceae bacterium]